MKFSADNFAKVIKEEDNLLLFKDIHCNSCIVNVTLSAFKRGTVVIVIFQNIKQIINHRHMSSPLSRIENLHCQSSRTCGCQNVIFSNHHPLCRFLTRDFICHEINKSAKLGIPYKSTLNDFVIGVINRCWLLLI